MSSYEFDIEMVQPIDPEELKIQLQEPFTEAEEPCSKHCKPVSYGLFPIPPLPVTNLCKTSNPPGQQTIVVFDPWTIEYKNVL